MGWMASGFSIISSRLGLAASRAGVEPGRIESVRRGMLAALGERCACDEPRLAHRLLVAHDLESLWYLRSDLLLALARLHGEAQARRLMDVVTEQFRGLMPESVLPHTVFPRRAAARLPG